MSTASPERSSSAPSPRQAAVRQLGLTPQKAFRPYILTILQENGGRMEVGKLLAELERRMESALLEGDYRLVNRGEVRWRNAARWERKDMVDEGLIKRSGHHGVWELTQEGMKTLT